MNQLGYITDNMYLKMIINIKLKKITCTHSIFLFAISLVVSHCNLDLLNGFQRLTVSKNSIVNWKVEVLTVRLIVCVVCTLNEASSSVIVIKLRAAISICAGEVALDGFEPPLSRRVFHRNFLGKINFFPLCFAG